MNPVVTLSVDTIVDGEKWSENLTEEGDKILAEIVHRLNGSCIYDASSRFFEVSKEQGIDLAEYNISTNEFFGILVTKYEDTPSEQCIKDTFNCFLKGDMPKLRIVQRSMNNYMNFIVDSCQDDMFVGSAFSGVTSLLKGKQSLDARVPDKWCIDSQTLRMASEKERNVFETLHFTSKQV